MDIIIGPLKTNRSGQLFVPWKIWEIRNDLEAYMKEFANPEEHQLIDHQLVASRKIKCQQYINSIPSVFLGSSELSLQIDELQKIISLCQKRNGFNDDLYDAICVNKREVIEYLYKYKKIFNTAPSIDIVNEFNNFIENLPTEIRQDIYVTSIINSIQRIQ